MATTTIIQLFVFMLAGFVGVQTINRIPPLPANTKEATREMPEIALVAAISGVCNSGGIRLMVWTPTKPASMKTNS